LKAWMQGVQYAYRYAHHKFDAFQAFGSNGANGGSHLPHSVVRPLATYAPWRADHEFQATFEVIRSNTLVDFTAATICGNWWPKPESFHRVTFSKSAFGEVEPAA
jgi:hypothetical protein